MLRTIHFKVLLFRQRLPTISFISEELTRFVPFDFDMYAIAFDLVVKSLQEHYGPQYTNAYYDIKVLLRKYGFFNVQGSVYIQYPLQRNADGSDAAMPNLYLAIDALKALSWFPVCVRDIRVFRVENWSDMTAIIKTQQHNNHQ